MLPSDSDANQFVGDIRSELDKALSYIEEMTFEEFQEDSRTFHAVEKVVQNAIEACIRLERQRKNKGMFTRLFPDFDFDDLKSIADFGRHDYSAVEPIDLWNSVHGTLTDLRNAAEALLAKKRH